MQNPNLTEMSSNNLEDELVEGETNLYRISSTKYTPLGIKEKLRTLYTSLEQFYLISHRIKNP
tara:strand:- start:311 stop:499 length:189 start_codon:yes stop_codon:yes gene_type:complete